MKKIIFITILPLTLAGCITNVAPSTKTITPPTQQSDSFLEKELPGYNKTHVLTIDTPAQGATRIKVSTLVEYGNPIRMTGCFYEHKYPNFGIKITTQDPFRNAFSTCPAQLFTVKGNKIINGEDGFIEVRHKISGTELIDSMKKNIVGIFDSGCTVSSGGTDSNGNERYFVIDSNDGSCRYKDTAFFTHFLVNPKKPNTYYQVTTADGCAPGECSDFGSIELE